jgi:metallophosphoesterase (TIGR00282 family)
MIVNILAVGDIAGHVGLDFLAKKLCSVKKLYDIAFTVVNAENAAGLGITPQQAEAVFKAGADVITLGNHTWGHRGIAAYLDDCPNILRPANFAPQAPGRGVAVYETAFGMVRVANLVGRTHMHDPSENPFLEADRILKLHDGGIALVDFHAEATSEKYAMAYFLDGRVSALWGTHTHVQTSDCGVLPGGMGYITDLGMTGPVSSVIGMKIDESISRFLGNPPSRFESSNDQAGKLEGAVFAIDADTGKCESVEALRVM